MGPNIWESRPAFMYGVYCDVIVHVFYHKSGGWRCGAGKGVEEWCWKGEVPFVCQLRLFKKCELNLHITWAIQHWDQF